MAGYFTESNYENAVLQLLNEELGYNYIYGPDVERDYHSPLYEDGLLPSLQRINKSLPMDALTEAIYKLKNFETGTLLQVPHEPQTAPRCNPKCSCGLCGFASETGKYWAE